MNLKEIFATFELHKNIVLLVLELRQYNNDSTEAKNWPVLKLPRFFPHHIGEWKAGQFQNKPILWFRRVILVLS